MAFLVTCRIAVGPCLVCLGLAGRRDTLPEKENLCNASLFIRFFSQRATADAPIPQISILAAASFFCPVALLFQNVFNLKGINTTCKMHFETGQQYFKEMNYL